MNAVASSHISPSLHRDFFVTHDRMNICLQRSEALTTCMYLCRIIPARLSRLDLVDDVLIDETLTLLGHGDAHVLLLVILAQLHNRKHSQAHPKFI